jgi:hypothetical protein
MTVAANLRLCPAAALRRRDLDEEFHTAVSEIEGLADDVRDDDDRWLIEDIAKVVERAAVEIERLDEDLRAAAS